jgi:hypothetical protein
MSSGSKLGKGTPTSANAVAGGPGATGLTSSQSLDALNELYKVSDALEDETTEAEDAAEAAKTNQVLEIQRNLELLLYLTTAKAA